MPEITLPNQDGVKITVTSGSAGSPSMDGQRVVLFFFGGPFSPVCEREVRAFRESHAFFAELGAEVFGVSRDTVDFLRAFRVKEGLPFDLLSDEGGRVRALLGIPKDFFIDGRQTYVIGRDGVAKKVYNNQLEPERHVEEALAALAEIYAADRATDSAEAQRLADEEVQQKNSIANRSSRFWDAAVKMVANTVSERVEGVAKDTRKFVQEIAEAPTVYGKLAQEKADEVALASQTRLDEETVAFQSWLQEAIDSSQRQIEEEALASQRRLQEAIDSKQRQIEEAALASQRSLEAAISDAQQWIADLPPSLQRSAQEKVNALQRQAQEKADALQRQAQERAEKLQRSIVETPSRLKEQAQRQVGEVSTRIRDTVQATRDEVQSKIETFQAQTQQGFQDMKDKVMGVAPALEVQIAGLNDAMRVEVPKDAASEAEVPKDAASEAEVPKEVASEAPNEAGLPDEVDVKPSHTLLKASSAKDQEVRPEDAASMQARLFQEEMKKALPRRVEPPKAVERKPDAIEEAAQILGISVSELRSKLQTLAAISHA